MAEYSKKPKVIAVVGPTASGKTALGVHLAKRFDGEVVARCAETVNPKLSTGEIELRATVGNDPVRRQ